MRRLLPSTLTSRLVTTAVLLVAVVGLLVTVGSVFALSRYLNGNLETQVDGTLGRAVGAWQHGGPGLPLGGGTPGDGGPVRHDGDDPSQIRAAVGQGVGTLTAEFDSYGQRGDLLTGRGGTGRSGIARDTLAVVRAVPADGHSHEVSLPRLGEYRLEAVSTPAGKVVAGLPTRQVQETLTSLAAWELLLTVLGVLLAALLGRLLVVRQLRPLRSVAATAHEVATMPLSSGEIGTTVRVPAPLTDPLTEVGAVGSALNTMLAHVESALDSRHRSEQQVRQFVADASHELRTPLSTIHGYAELSRRTTPADPAQLTQAMAKVEAEADRMSTLVEDLLLLARLDSGRPLAKDEVDLTKLVLETVDDARVVAPDHHWLLDLTDEPVVVRGDEQRLHQVVTNLLNNARRHTPPSTRVVVGAKLDGRHGAALLTVSDDGPGMSPELVDKAFERFTRGDSSRTRASGGAGLGLSLVEAIASAHGGSVSVTSEPGRTRFAVRLPRLTATP